MPTPLTTDAIWSNLSSDLRRFIRRRVPDEHASDDLLQETFLRIHHNLGKLQEADRLAAWVYQIARNVVYDYYRRAVSSGISIADPESLLAEAELCSRIFCNDAARSNPMREDKYWDAFQRPASHDAVNAETEVFFHSVKFA